MSESAPDSVEKKQLRLVVFTACLASFVVGYNAMATITALPVMKSDLDIDALTLQWVMNIYMVSAAALVAMMGRFADIFGKIRMFSFGCVVFAIGSLAIVVGETVWIIMIGRLLQGIGASTIFGSSVAIISVASSDEDRSTALGLWGGTVSAGLAIGSLIGGVLTDAVSWRMIFAVDVVLLVISFFLAIRIARQGIVKEPQRKRMKIDFVGAGLLAITLASLAYAISAAHTLGWTSATILGLFALSIISAFLFVANERRAKDPLVYFRFLTRPRFLAGAMGMLVTGWCLGATMYFYNLFVQSPDTFSFSATKAGVALLPFSGLMALFSYFMPRLLKAYSFHWPLTLGLAAAAVGLAFLQNVSDGTTYGDLWWKLGLAGMGLGTVFSLSPRVALRVLKDEHAGQGSGIINTCLYFGFVLGVTIGSVFSDHIRLAEARSAIAKLNFPEAEANSIVNDIILGSGSELKAALAKLPADKVADIQKIVVSVLDDGFSAAILIAAVLAGIATIACYFLTRTPYITPVEGADA